jgi:hypothetical protein
VVSVDLDDTSNCPLGRVCEGCGKSSRRRRVWTVGSQVGIGCKTLCGPCARGGPQSTSAGAAVLAVMEHCEHLGITGDEMAVLMDAEEVQSNRQPGRGRRKR